jgi:phospholipid/cholesterol/gamma-HCH transport system ATP-binding protein
MTREEAIHLRDVTVIRDEVTILKGITLSIPRGKTTVFMGPSGCGKSILLKVAAGIFPPEAGEVLIDGRDIRRIPDRELSALRKSHGFVFQDAALWANKSVYQNLSLPLEFHGRDYDRGEIDRRIAEVIRRVAYTDSDKLRPAQLSSGERKIVGFGRAIINDPELLFLDDPTGSVDHTSGSKLLRVIKDLKAEGRTLLIATHDPELTGQVADYLVIMTGGTILESGPFESVVHSPDRRVAEILSEVLSQTSTYAGDILDLLNPTEEKGDNRSR